MKLAIASLLVGSAAAFAPAQEAFRAPTSLQATATDAKVRRENLAAIEQSRAKFVGAGKENDLDATVHVPWGGRLSESFEVEESSTNTKSA